MQPFLAVITPVGSPAQPPTGGSPPTPDQTLPGNLPKPEHPIYYPLPPGAPVDPSYGVPIEHPEHPIATPPGSPPKPDQGPQPHPEHPIVLPPNSGGWDPVYIWGGGNMPVPTPPIALPPPGSAPEAKIEWKAAWTPTTGWIVIGVPAGAHPAPSKK